MNPTFCLLLTWTSVTWMLTQKMQHCQQLSLRIMTTNLQWALRSCLTNLLCDSNEFTYTKHFYTSSFLFKTPTCFPPSLSSSKILALHFTEKSWANRNELPHSASPNLLCSPAFVLPQSLVPSVASFSFCALDTTSHLLKGFSLQFLLYCITMWFFFFS